MFFHFVQMKLLDKSFGIYFVKLKAERDYEHEQLYN